LFEPHLLGKDTPGCSRMIVESIEQAEEPAKAQLASNIVLIGGSSLFTGFPERINHDLAALLPPQYKAHIDAPEGRNFLAWAGASRFAANHEAFCDMCLAKSEYQEKGPNCVGRFG
jgi:actin-related protein